LLNLIISCRFRHVWESGRKNPYFRKNTHFEQIIKQSRARRWIDITKLQCFSIYWQNFLELVVTGFD
jgi:hypothetical protein